MPNRTGACLTEELARLRQEFKDLQALIAASDPPLDAHTLKIARAKIDTLLNQISELDAQRTRSG
jgi:hypothetical protein